MRMRGACGKARCSVPGHGTHCEVAREKKENYPSRTEEKRDWRKEVRNATEA